MHLERGSEEGELNGSRGPGRGGRSHVMSQLPADTPLAMLHQMLFRFTQPMQIDNSTSFNDCVQFTNN